MARLVEPCALAALAALASCTIEDNDGRLRIDNDSGAVLVEVRLAAEGSPFFGRDLTGPGVLVPGESVSILLECHDYDVLVIDELDLECVINTEVCFDRTILHVTDQQLEGCAAE